jgi:hypothetical protein
MSLFFSILALFSAGTGIVLMWILLHRFFFVPITLITSLLPVVGTNQLRRLMRVKRIGFNTAVFIKKSCRIEAFDIDFYYPDER